MTDIPTSNQVAADRGAAILADHQQSIWARTDHLFAGLLAFEWLAGIVIAVLRSPRTWSGSTSAIIDLARHLGLKLIAEGIETADQVALLQGMDCELAQGYYFGRPTDAAGAEELLVRSPSDRSRAA